MKTWAEVYNDPEYSKLTSEEWKEVRKQYFQDVVAPGINKEDHEAVWSEFNKDADGLARPAPEAPAEKTQKVELTADQKKAEAKSLRRDLTGMLTAATLPKEPLGYSSESIAKYPSVQADVARSAESSSALARVFSKAEREGKDPLDEAIKIRDDRRGVVQAIKEAPGSTLSKLLMDTVSSPGKETDTELIWGQYEPQGIVEKIAHGAITGTLDAPYYVAGGFLGGLSGNPLVAGGAAMALPEAFRAAAEAKMEGMSAKDATIHVLDKTAKGFGEGMLFAGAGKMASTVGGEIATLKQFQRLQRAGEVGKSVKDFAAFRTISKMPGFPGQPLGKVAQGALNISAETGALAGAQAARGEDVTAGGLAESLVAMKLSNAVPHIMAKHGQARRIAAGEMPVEVKAPVPEVPVEAPVKNGISDKQFDYVNEQKIGDELIDAKSRDAANIYNGEAEVLAGKNKFDVAPPIEERVYPEGKTDKEIFMKLPVEERKYMREIDRVKYDKGRFGERLDEATNTLLDSIDRHQDPQQVWKDQGTMDVDYMSNPALAKLPVELRKEVFRRIKNTLEKRYSQRYATNMQFIEEQKADRQPYLKINNDTNVPADSAPMPGTKLANRRALESPPLVTETGETPIDPDVMKQAEINAKSARLIDKAWASERSYNREGINEAIDSLFAGNPRLEAYGDPVKDVPTKRIMAKLREYDIAVIDPETGEKKMIPQSEYVLKSRMPIKEAELNIYDELGTMGMDKKNPWARTFTHPWTNFSRKIEIDAGQGMKRLLVDPARQADYNAKVEIKDKFTKHEKFIKENKISTADRKKAGEWMLWQDPDGRATLENNGIKSEPVLTPGQKKYADYARKQFNEMIQQVNDMEDATGIAKTQRRDNYITLLRLFEWGEEMGVKGSVFSAEREVDKTGSPRKVPFQFGKERISDNKRGIETDLKRIMDRYVYESVMYKHKTPFIAKQRDLMVASDLGNRNPGAYNYIKNFLDYQSGIPQNIIFKNPVWKKILNTMNRNVGLSTIAYNFKVYATQPTAIMGAIVEFGGLRTLKVGIPAMFNPVKVKEAYAKSQHLKTRIMDINMEEARTGVSGKLSHAREAAAEVGYIPVKYLDLWTAIGTWHTAVDFGKKVKGLSGRELYRYADDMVVKTQASASPVDVAPIQYSPEGKAFTMFGTFGINKFNWLMRDVIGYNNPNVSRKQAIGHTMRYVAAVAAMNSLYEMFGSKPPDPAPISTLKNEIAAMNEDEQKTFGSVILNVAREGMEVLPVGGKGGSWGGKALLGAPATLIFELSEGLAGKKDAPPVSQSLMKLVGFPGTQQIFKMYNERKKAEKAAALEADVQYQMGKVRRDTLKSAFPEGQPTLRKLMQEDDDTAFNKFMEYKLPK